MTVEEKLEILESNLLAISEKYATALTIIESQSARIADLEAQLLTTSTANSVTKTSKNSHIPPSVDLTRKNQSLREKSDKPVGGQMGHKGHTLEMSDTPDKIESLYPDFCNNCGLSLAQASFEMTARRQVIDIPPILPIITEFQRYSTTCTCGHHQSGTFPDGVDSNIQYGKNIQSLAVYQSCYQFVPFARLQDFFKKVCHVPISKGTIENIIRRTAQKSQNTYESLRQIIVLSFFVGSDETGFKLKGSKGWFWVWQNAMVTYIVAACSRSKQVISDHFPEGLPNSILCSDRLAAQLSTISKGSQLCLGHLLRDLNYLIDAEKDEKTSWAIDFKILLKDAIEMKQQASHYDEKDKKVLNIQQRADKLLNNSILEEFLKNNIKFAQTIVFLRAMIKHRDALFRFLYHPLIPFDNNGSERAIRNVKIKTKISGQFKSLHHEFAVIRSIVDTAIKNGNSVFHAVQAMVDLPVSSKSAG
jgi:transposase